MSELQIPFEHQVKKYSVQDLVRIFEDENNPTDKKQFYFQKQLAF